MTSEEIYKIFDAELDIFLAHELEIMKQNIEECFMLNVKYMNDEVKLIPISASEVFKDVIRSSHSLLN